MEWAIQNEGISIISFIIVRDSETLANQIQRQNIFYPICIVPDHIVKTSQLYYQISGGCSWISIHIQYPTIC